MTRASGLAAILRATPPSPFAEALAAGLMADGLMRVQRAIHWAVRFAQWRWSCEPRHAWLAFMMRKAELASEILEATAAHTEANGFDDGELDRLEIQLAIIMQAMERTNADARMTA